MASTGRLIGLLVWSLLPCAAIWIGLIVIQSAAWSFALYHGLCLFPAIVWGRKLWVPTWKWPNAKTLVLLLVAVVIFNLIAFATYEVIGHMLLSDEAVLELLKDQGFSKSMFWPLSIYAIVVNPVVEEIYWRGVLFNELEKYEKRWKYFAIVWSSLAYAGFHYTIFRMVLFPGWAELGTLMLVVYGALMAVLYRKTGSIITVAIAHGLLTDLACIVLIVDLLLRFPGSL